jgi:hypothetical protein
MVVQEYNDPVPHIVVDDFLDIREYHQVLDLIEESVPALSAGQVHTPAGTNQVVTDFKRNGNVWLDSFTSNIVNIFRNNFFAIPVSRAELDCRDRMHEVLLSQYVAGDFYNWHTDLGGHCTWNYFIYKEPKQFSGGDFVISDSIMVAEQRANTKIIECVNNRLVIFPAQYQHCVTAVQGSFLEPTSARYSIQVFFR